MQRVDVLLTTVGRQRNELCRIHDKLDQRVKHQTQGPEQAHHRFQSGPLKTEKGCINVGLFTGFFFRSTAYRAPPQPRTAHLSKGVMGHEQPELCL